MTLLEQYENLSLEEKNDLLIYKSRLSYVINNLYNDDFINEAKDIYDYYKKIFAKPENYFISNIFSKVNFNTFETFMDSMKVLDESIENMKYKITLDEDITLYRMASLINEEDILNISVGNLISTSRNIDVVSKFKIPGEYINVLYEIKVPAGTPCLIIPYSLKVSDDIMRMVSTDDQEEIILFKDELDMDILKEEDKVSVTCNLKNRLTR